jgi:hypothetical protein
MITIRQAPALAAIANMPATDPPPAEVDHRYCFWPECERLAQAHCDTHDESYCERHLEDHYGTEHQAVF